MKKNKQIFISLLTLAILFSGVSLVNASGVWMNPTATPPQGNVDAPINVGTSAQDKAGVLRVTGFRSFFDAIFDTKVEVGTAGTIPDSLNLLVGGNVGAAAYCDENGNNCVTSSGIATTGGGNGGNGSFGAPNYDSGWIDFGSSGTVKKKFVHNLGTSNYMIYIEDKGTGGNNDNCPSSVGNGSINGWWGGTTGSPYLYYYDKGDNSVSVSDAVSSLSKCARYVRVQLWEYPAGTIASPSSIVNI